nr:reverse transcriptase domain-containing protein [Tanacetum cinerariifolium]
MVKALLLDKKCQNQSPAPMKVVEESYVTCGGAHSYHNCPATDGNIYHDNIQEFVSQASAVNYNQGNTSYRPPMMSNQIRPPGFLPVPNNQNAQLNQRNNQNRFIPNQNQGNNFNQGPVYQPLVFQPPAYQAPAYQASAPQTQVVDYVVDPCVPLILGRPFLRTGRALIYVYGEELTLRVDDEAITFTVGQTLKYSYNDAELINRIDVIDVACEEYIQEVLGFLLGFS